MLWLVTLLAADTAPVSPVWGLANAVLNGLTLIGVAFIGLRRPK